MSIEKIGIIANVEKEQSDNCTIELRDWATKKGIQVFLEEGIARKIGAGEGMDRRTLAARVDLLVVLGETEPSSGQCVLSVSMTSPSSASISESSAI